MAHRHVVVIENIYLDVDRLARVADLPLNLGKKASAIHKPSELGRCRRGDPTAVKQDLEAGRAGGFRGRIHEFAGIGQIAGKQFLRSLPEDGPTNDGGGHRLPDDAEQCAACSAGGKRDRSATAGRLRFTAGGGVAVVVNQLTAGSEK